MKIFHSYSKYHLNITESHTTNTNQSKIYKIQDMIYRNPNVIRINHTFLCSLYFIVLPFQWITT